MALPRDEAAGLPSFSSGGGAPKQLCGRSVVPGLCTLPLKAEGGSGFGDAIGSCGLAVGDASDAQGRLLENLRDPPLFTVTAAVYRLGIVRLRETDAAKPKPSS